MKPRDWCEPSSAFGDLQAKQRHWLPPARQEDREIFRAAVLQHAISVSVKRWKNSAQMSQQMLANLDDREGSTVTEWNARLNGRRAMTLRDLAVIVRVLPGALPDENDIRTLLNVAEKRDSRPTGWSEVDS